MAGGRPPLNESSKKSKVKSVRLAPWEVAALEKRFGTVSRALRRLVDVELSRSFRSTNTVPSRLPRDPEV